MARPSESTVMATNEKHVKAQDLPAIISGSSNPMCRGFLLPLLALTLIIFCTELALTLVMTPSHSLSIPNPTIERVRALPPPPPVLPIPMASQLEWQLGDMAMFLHFGPNTFTDSEWGTGHAPPSVFNPTRMDPAQWVRVAKESGFSRVILTAKHHDGFCLWPSELTDYSVRSSSWRNGAGDVVGEVAAAAKEAGIGLGLYLSPWDRHEECYGKTMEYNEFYMGQMRELLTWYGEIEEVWLDGAKGDGDKDMDYFFDSWFSLIHQLQPGAVIFSEIGPDTRWVGDEAGTASRTCWSIFNTSNAVIGGTDPQYLMNGDPTGPHWVPPECDVSIRSGWFWHRNEAPKSARALLDIYYKSVGRNCVLLLSVAPNSSGLISNEDIEVLREFQGLRDSIFSHNLANNAFLNASSTRGGIHDSRFSPRNLLLEGIHSYWAPEKNWPNWVIDLQFPDLVTFNVLKVQEPIHMGQRIAKFHVKVLSGVGHWRRVINGTTVGYQRFLRFQPLETRRLRFVVNKSRGDPLISYLGVHLDKFSNPISYEQFTSAYERKPGHRADEE